MFSTRGIPDLWPQCTGIHYILLINDHDM